MIRKYTTTAVTLLSFIAAAIESSQIYVEVWLVL